MDSKVKYTRIANWVCDQIASGILRPKDKLCTEAELSRRFNCSRQTVRRSLEILENKGRIYRIQGSGTYIAERPENEKPIKPAELQNRELSMNVGIICTFMDNFIFPLILRGVESGFAEKGFTLQLAWTNNTVTGETKAIELFMEKKLDGLILEPTRSALPFVNRNLFDELLKRNLPLVFIDSYYPEIDIPYVVMDDVKAGYIATEYLIRNGHKDIAFVLPHINRQGHLRYSGYTQALTEAGLPIDDNHIIWYSSKENMHQILNSKELLDTLSRCSAVICYNDSIALELIGFVSKNNFRIPDDISVIGIDGSEIAQFTGLTSVVHPARQLGETAVKLLLSMINGGEGKNYIFPPSLVERNTVKKI